MLGNPNFVAQESREERRRGITWFSGKYAGIPYTSTCSIRLEVVFSMRGTGAGGE